MESFADCGFGGVRPNGRRRDIASVAARRRSRYITAMGNIDNWILGASSAILGTAGLFVSAKSGHGIGYFGGIGIFLLSACFVLYLIKTAYDHD